MTPPAAEQPDPLLTRVLDPAAPRALQLAAARGALPLGRQELLLALVRLQAGGDAEITAEAEKSLAAFSAEVLVDILASPQTDPRVLDHFARRAGTSAGALAVIVTNTSATDDLLLHLAASPQAEILDIMVVNEARLIRTPSLPEALKANPALSRDSRRRLAELEEHVLSQKPAGLTGPPVPREPIPESEGEVPLAPVYEEGAEAAPMLVVPLTVEEQAAEEALKSTPLYQRIIRMNVAEKIQAAVKGNSEERAILIRDPSRVVAATVLKSPKVNDQEIESYANLRNVNDEVLRIIGNHREWTKSYGVALALARNPRSPTGISLTMLNRLVNKDLKNLGTDKNIPEVIRRSAKRLFELRTKPPEKGKRK